MAHFRQSRDRPMPTSPYCATSHDSTTKVSQHVILISAPISENRASRTTGATGPGIVCKTRSADIAKPRKVWPDANRRLFLNDDEVGWLLEEQRRLILAWLESQDAHETALRLLKRRALSYDPSDLINDSWIKVDRSFDGRSTPLPEMSSEREAARYGARVLDNRTRDLARRQRRAPEALVSPTEFDWTDSDGGGVDERILVEQLLLEVSRLIPSMTKCPGCDDNIVASSALTLLHLVLNGSDGSSRGRTWIDQMLHAAIDHVDPRPEISQAARDQRKSRCGRCVVELLSNGMASLREAAL